MLPHSLQQNYGYHHQYYCLFVVVEKVYHTGSSGTEKNKAKKRTIRSPVVQNLVNCLGMFEIVSLFCQKSQKKKSQVEQRLIRVET